MFMIDLITSMHHLISHFEKKGEKSCFFDTLYKQSETSI